MLRCLALFALGLAGALVASPATAQPAGDLAAALRGGGYTILLRHGVAVTGARPESVAALPEEFRRCRGTDRLMSDQGVADMRAVGAAVAALAIPIDTVFSSPLCRSIESVLLVTGRPTVTAVMGDLAGMLAASEADAEDVNETRLTALRRVLSSAPMPGTNTLVSTHDTNIAGATGLMLEQGEAAILRPDGAGGYTVAARLAPADWARLAARARGG